jgi:hypothetical protein
MNGFSLLDLLDGADTSSAGVSSASSAGASLAAAAAASTSSAADAAHQRRRRKAPRIGQRSRKGGGHQKVTGRSRTLEARVLADGPTEAAEHLVTTLLTTVRDRVYARISFSTAEKKAFVRESNTFAVGWRDVFVGPQRDVSGTIRCAGRYNGSPCSKRASWSRASPELLSSLSMDHEAEIEWVMDTWVDARSKIPNPTRWDAGVVAHNLLPLLFAAVDGPWGPAWVRPRCSACHKNMPHSRITSQAEMEARIVQSSP